MASETETFDIVIVGSGAGGLCAALAAHDAGKSVVIVEKEPVFGGTSSRSGGAVWVPCNHLMESAGVTDSEADALTYANACVKEHTAAASPERLAAYVHSGREMVRFLTKLGVKLRYAQGYSDYYDDRPGARGQGRAIEAELLDSRELGEWAEKLNRYAPFSIPMRVSEFSDLSNATRTMKGRFTALKLGYRLFLQRIRKRQIIGQGAALQGRMLIQLLKRNIAIKLSSPVTALISEGGRIAGVTVMANGKPLEVRARDAVFLNSGGFSRNLTMRQQYLPAPQASTDLSLANPGDTGEMLQAAAAQGGELDQMNEAWWLVAAELPGGMVVSHTLDLSKPHVIMVDASGQRYVNEALAYMELGQTMFARNRQGKALPSWAIFDSMHRRRYTWGMAMPGQPPVEWIESGFLKRADTIRDLALQCGVDPDGLEATVARFNGFVAKGRDEDFGRGNRGYEQMNGDPSIHPNPNLGTIAKAPFYASPIMQGDAGTCGGVVTDADARVLRPDGSVIEGLYAFGNVAANVFGRSYPGPGITLGQSMIFGYRAALHAIKR